MYRELLSLQSYHGFTLDIVDIDDNSDLQVRYGVRIPVLCHRDAELCSAFLDRQAVIDVLESG